MRLLFVASDPMEFTGVVNHLQDPEPAQVAVDWARSGKLGGQDVLLAANGIGWKRAAAAVDAGVGFRPDAVVSLGYCGALEEDLEVGDIVVGTSIVRKRGTDTGGTAGANTTLVAKAVAPAFPDSCTATHRAARTGVVCSLDHVAQTAEEKLRLRGSGASVLEMEAAGVAERAQTLGLRFHCVKVVTDLAGETMANDFNSALRSDGHFDTMLILRRSLRHPAVRLPELLRLRNRCVRAARVLGEFIADCRF